MNSLLKTHTSTLLGQAGILMCFALLSSISNAAIGDAAEAAEHKAKSLEIYRTIVEIPTVAGRGNGQKIVDYLSQEFVVAGFSPDDIKTIAVDDAVGLTVRYAGKEGSNLMPILLLGHMDVVEALDSDWERSPFTLNEDESYFYGRGTIEINMACLC
jgi:carboxypeptidase PM20D1